MLDSVINCGFVLGLKLLFLRNLTKHFKEIFNITGTPEGGDISFSFFFMVGSCQGKTTPQCLLVKTNFEHVLFFFRRK